MLVIVLDALALVRLGRTLRAHFCCKLADLFLVDTLDNDLVRVRDIDLDVRVLGHGDRVREAQVHDQVLTFLHGSVADAVDLERLAEALGHADDHIVDQRAGQAVQGAVQFVIARAGDVDGVAFDRDGHVRVHVVRQGALRALDGDNVAIAGDFNACGNLNGSSTNSRHCSVPPLPHEREDFAADVLRTRLLVGHDALRGGNDRDAEAAQDLRQLVSAGVDTQAGLGDSAEALDGLLFAGEILQGDADDALGAVINELEALDVAFLEKNFGDGLLHLGIRDVHGFVPSAASVADAGQHIGDGIGDLHLCFLLS